MKILMLAFALSLTIALSAASEPVVLASVDLLTAKGVTFRRTRLDTPGASVQIEVSVENTKGLGTFDSIECAVTSEPIASELLAATDTSGEKDGRILRRTKSSKTNSVFFVRGAELPKAYFAMEFSRSDDAGNKAVTRYLFPAAIARGKKASQ